MLEIADEGRYDQYDLMLQKTLPLVPREHRLVVRERVDVHGGVRTPLDEDGCGRWCRFCALKAWRAWR